MSSGRRKNQVKTGTIVKIVIALVVLGIVIFVGMNIMRSKVDEQFASDEESTVESAQVTTGEISTTVVGSGTLAFEEAEELTIPSSVEIKEYYVSSGDSVKEGDLLASVNTTSLVVAMSDLQDEIAELDEELADVADETIDDEITASVSGRVKAIFAEAGDDVASVMYEKGALLLISMDGKMAVDIETDDLAEDDSVSVKVDGSSYTGTVEKVLAGVATITFTDNGPAYEAEAAVSKSGKVLGSGTTYIHRSITATGYAGTVKKVSVSENESVDAGDTLFTLEDTSYTANYDSLLSEREDLEEDLQNLLIIYKEGAVYARESGVITSLTKGTYTGSDSSDDSSDSSSVSSSASAGGDAASMMSMYGMTSQTTTTQSESTGNDTVFAISPDDTMDVTVSVDESDILALEVGQEATVTVDSLDDESFSGSVTEISTEGTSSGGVTTYSAVVSIPRSESMLSGMSADVTIVIEGVEDALLIPIDALHKTRSTAYVYTSYNEETDTLGDMVEVTVGITNSTYAEITEGLSEGDTIYYEPSDDEDGFDFSSFGGMGGMGDMGGSSFGGGRSSGSDRGGSQGSMPSGMPGQ